MNWDGVIKLLLVEDDEDDYILARELLAEIPGKRFVLDWANTFETGLEALSRNQHDIALVDYRLGAHDGVELLRAGLERGSQAPVILLTGAGQHQVDLEAMRAGAADFLVKAGLQAQTLERSIRYTIQRKRAAALAAFEQARLAAFGAEVGLALSRRGSLESILERCARAMVQYLNAALAQVSTFDLAKQLLVPCAAAGPLFDLHRRLDQLPNPRLEVGPLSEGKAVLIKQVLDDPRVPFQEWVRHHGVISYAAFPLVLEETLVGVMSIFTHHPLADSILQEMASVANGISLCIEKERSAEALDASEVKYRSVVENIKEVIFQMDGFGHWTFLNPAWTEVTGFDTEASMGTFFLEYIHGDDREQNRHIFLQLVEGKLSYCRYETRLLTKAGKVRWAEMYAQRTLDPDGSIIGTSGTVTDITERKLAENAIQKLAAFPQVNPNPVLEFASDGTLTYANNAANDLVMTLEKQDLASILPVRTAEIVHECLRSGLKRLREEIVINGRTVFWSFFPVVASQVVHCYGADVTDVLSLEAQLRHAQKLESVGQLAAGVAHDFNNILTVIQGYSECLLARSGGDQASKPALTQIAGAAKRAAALTRQLLLFSRKQMIQTKVLDLNSVLQNLANMLARLLGEDVALETNYSAHLPCIQADTGMLEQVVMNLAVNSRDAMPRGGKLILGTSRIVTDELYARRNPNARPGTFVCLSVTDTGCGMDQKTLERIFEPFFSTKEVGKGTGLGLATVYGIVQQHQGWIEVDSQPGHGTTFRIFFPAIEQPQPAASDTAVVTRLAVGGNETLLVVEDEPLVREFVCDVLREFGYRVIEVGSGVEALRVWDEFDGQIDLLLTDMVLPQGMTGRELVSHLKSREPALKVVFTSGYSPETLGKDFNTNETFFLSKPYLPPQLIRTIRDCLDSPAKRTSGELVPT
jgi:PAS domain S-box-containing protein